MCDAEKEWEMLTKLADLTGQIADGGDLLVLEPLKHKLDRELADFQITRHPGYQVVGDNVDMRILVRFMLMMAQDREIHHCNHLAITNRVNAHHLQSIPRGWHRAWSCRQLWMRMWSAKKVKDAIAE